ncbi:hypothetical protein JCM33374_g4122 [Metschnikowia sp. JCM 33374]|nr:hypothetical protein JCM33374_g4122 [Metschnikowia sp. JCM 33374]
MSKSGKSEDRVLKNEYEVLFSGTESDSDDEFVSAPLAPPPDMKKYGDEMYVAFKKRFTKVKENRVTIPSTDPGTHIASLVKGFKDEISGTEKPVEDLRSKELVIAARAAMKAIRNNYICKALMAAADPDMFHRYFPELKGHHSWFEIEHRATSAAVLKSFPCLRNSVKVRSGPQELGEVIAAMNLVTEENSEWERTSSEKDDLVIQLMAELHKGTSDAGLLRIVEKVRKFKEDYPDESDLKPESYLRRLISGYGIGSEKIINKWYKDECSGGKVDTFGMIDMFIREQWPKLSQAGQVRREKRREEDAETHRAFMQAIKGVEDDFYPLRTPEGAAGVHAHRAEKSASPTSTTNGQSSMPGPSPGPDRSTLPWKRPLQILRDYFQSHPNKCMNCFEEHKWDQCTNVKPDTRDNLAAYLVKEFSEKNGTKFYRHLSAMIDIVATVPHTENTTNVRATLTETKTTDGNKNYSTVTETEDGDLTVTETDKIDGDKSYCTVPETENIGRDKSYCTAPETANTDRDKSDCIAPEATATETEKIADDSFFLTVDGTQLTTIENLIPSEITSEFIIDTGADASVTGNKALIQDFQSWGHLSIYDSGGHHHLSEGYGHIKLGDHVIRCYYVPTLEVSVISIYDLHDLAEHTIFRSNGDVYLTDTGKKVLQKVGYMERQHFHSMVGFVGLQNKKDKFNAYNIHRVHAHPNVEVTRQLCLDNQIPFTKADETAIRNCPSCFRTKGKAMSHNGHPSNPPKYPLHRLHMDSMELGNSRYVTLIIDGFTLYVWHVMNTDKGELLKMSKMEIERIQNEFPEYKCVFITKDNGTELPTEKFLKEEFNIVADKIPAYTPQLNGLAERMNGVILLKAISLLDDATTNDVIRELLELLAIRHAILVHNTVPNSEGSTPKALLHGKKVKINRGMPIFGSDVIVQLSNASDLMNEKLQTHRLPGIYVARTPLIVWYILYGQISNNRMKKWSLKNTAISVSTMSSRTCAKSKPPWRQQHTHLPRSTNQRPSQVSLTSSSANQGPKQAKRGKQPRFPRSKPIQELHSQADSREKRQVAQITDFEQNVRSELKNDQLVLHERHRDEFGNIIRTGFTQVGQLVNQGIQAIADHTDRQNERRDNNLRTAFTQGYESLSNHLDKGLHAIADHTENTNAVRDQNIRTELGHALITGSDMITQYIDHRIVDETQPAAYIVHDAFFDEIRREYVEVNRHQIEEEQYDQTLIRDDAASTNNPAGKLITADGVSIDIPTEEEMTDEEMTPERAPPPLRPLFSPESSLTSIDFTSHVTPANVVRQEIFSPESSMTSEEFPRPQHIAYKERFSPATSVTSAEFDPITTDTIHSHTAADTDVFSTDDSDGPATTDESLDNIGPLDSPGHDGNDPAHDSEDEYSDASEHFIPAREESHKSSSAPIHDATAAFPDRPPTEPLPSTHITSSVADAPADVSPTMGAPDPVSITMGADPTYKSPYMISINSLQDTHRSQGGRPNTTDQIQQATHEIKNMRNYLIQKYGNEAVEQAEEDEIRKLQNMEVYDEVEKHAKPNAERLIGTRFVYTEDVNDKKSNGKVKARLVAQGFKQEIEREETYSPVVSPDSLRLFMTASVIKRMELKAMDVSSAYLHSSLKIPVYVRPPSGIRGVDDRKLWMCTKALYGLKNAGRAWYLMIKEKLEENGFKRVRSERSIFRKITARGTEVIIALYVDDLLVGVEDEKDYEDFQNYMRDEAKIKIKDLGEAKDFCGVQIDRIDGGYKIHQKKYIDELLGKFERFMTQETQTVPFKEYDRERYESELNAKELRLARDVDLAQLKRVLLYLRDTKDFAIEIRENHYPDNKVKLYAFADASFANEEGRKSRTGYIIYLNGTPIAWKSKKQTLVTTSTHASEYVALSTTVNDLLWLRDLFQELGIETVEVPKILEDNRGVVLSVNGTGNNPSCNKHLDVKVKHVQERVSIGDIEVESVGTEDNVADTLTKGLTRIPFGRHYPYLGFDGKFMIRALKAMRSYCPVCRE